MHFTLPYIIVLEGFYARGKICVPECIKIMQNDMCILKPCGKNYV